MRRFFAPPECIRGGEIWLPDDEAHHARVVLRLRDGEDVTVLDGDGRERAGELRHVGRRGATVLVREERRQANPGCAICLAVALPKGKTMEWIVEKATELGAREIVPVITGRTVAQPPAGKGDAKTAKWRAVAISAIKQCGSPWLPKIREPMSLAMALENLDRPELDLVAALAENRETVRARFASFRGEQTRAPRTVRLWIGPEGDFTPDELEMFRVSGIRPVTLGERVLRTETAAVAGLAMIVAECLAE